jgi:Fe-S-cluster containining protein
MDNYRESGMEKENRKFFIVALKEEARKVLWDVNSSADADQLVESALADLEALAPREEGVETRSEEEIWTQVRRRLLKAAYETRPYCVRCGQCCQVGSPTLVDADRELFVKDVLKPEDLYTIRKGELVRTLEDEDPATLDSEMIKIKEKPDSSTCIFFEKNGNICSIYDSRPSQCRSQECWNPESGLEAARMNRLSREVILKPVDALWKIVERHDQKCSYDELNRVVSRLRATKGQTVNDLLDLLTYDDHVRDFVTQNFGLERSTLDFFFGRPLQESLAIFGLKVIEGEDGAKTLTVADGWDMAAGPDSEL